MASIFGSAHDEYRRRASKGISVSNLLLFALSPALAGGLEADHVVLPREIVDSHYKSQPMIDQSDFIVEISAELVHGEAPDITVYPRKNRLVLTGDSRFSPACLQLSMQNIACPTVICY